MKNCEHEWGITVINIAPDNPKFLEHNLDKQFKLKKRTCKKCKLEETVDYYKEEK